MCQSSNSFPWVLIFIQIHSQFWRVHFLYLVSYYSSRRWAQRGLGRLTDRTLPNLTCRKTSRFESDGDHLGESMWCHVSSRARLRAPNLSSAVVCLEFSWYNARLKQRESAMFQTGWVSIVEDLRFLENHLEILGTAPENRKVSNTTS